MFLTLLNIKLINLKDQHMIKGIKKKICYRKLFFFAPVFLQFLHFFL